MATPLTHAAEARTLGGLPIVGWPAFDEHPLDAIVTTRAGGVSTGPYATLNLGLHVGDVDERVIANRSTVARAMGAQLTDFVYCEQAHQPHVIVVTEEHAGRGTRSLANAIAATDAMVTTVPGIILAVMVADCVPLVLFDPVARVLAAVHAGWGGTVRGVTPAAVAAMRELGTQPADLVVGIGPSIAPERYQVGADVVAAAALAFPDRIDDVTHPDGSGAWTFDLWRANTLQLLDAGVPEGQIHLAGLGTGPGTDFFSHRFEGPCGRFAAFARLHEVAA